MMQKKEIMEWLQVLPDDALVAVDDGGLALLVVEPGKGGHIDAQKSIYLEVGGVPEEEEAQP